LKGTDIHIGFYVLLTTSRYIQLKKNQLDTQFIFIIFCQTPLHILGISTAHHQEIHLMDTTIGTCSLWRVPFSACTNALNMFMAVWTVAQHCPWTFLFKVRKAKIKRLGAVLYRSPYCQHRHLIPLVSVQAQARGPWACLWHWCMQKMDLVRQNNKYQLLCPYCVPPDDGL
jgi:hypothetical protein